MSRASKLRGSSKKSHDPSRRRARHPLRDTILWIKGHPLTLFQLAVLALHHREFSLAYGLPLLAGAFALDEDVKALAAIDVGLKKLWEVVRFVRKHSTCTYTSIDINRVAKRDILTEYLNQIGLGKPRLEDQFRRFFGMRSVKDTFIDRTRIYYVGKGAVPERPCPTAFSTGFGGFIFVSESLENIVGIQRFYVLHEIGHLLGSSGFLAFATAAYSSSSLFLFIWAIPQILIPHYGTWSLAALINCYLMSTVLRDAILSTNREHERCIDEMWADQFAVANLDRKESMTVARFYERWPLPADSSLDSGMNALRQKNLSELLKQAVKIRDKRRRPDGRFFPEGMFEWPGWVCVVLAASLVPFANPPNLWSAAAAFFVWFITQRIYWRSRWRFWDLNRWLAAVLAVKNATPVVVGSWPRESWLRRYSRSLLGLESVKSSWPRRVIRPGIRTMLILILIWYHPPVEDVSVHQIVLSACAFICMALLVIVASILARTRPSQLGV